jgi:opacity protein-like surface antigen
LSAAEPEQGGYLSLDGGVSRCQDAIVQDGNGNSSQVEFDTGLRFDLRFGARSPQGWSGEIDLGVLYHRLKTNPLNPGGGKLSLYQVPIMLDAGYSLRLIGPLRLNLGGGIGPVFGVLSGDGASLIGASSDLSFGYQGFGGLSYALSHRVDIGLTYKYLGTTTHDWGSGIEMDGTRTHALVAALTFKF